MRSTTSFEGTRERILRLRSHGRSGRYANWRSPGATSGTAGLARFLVDTDVFVDHLRAAHRLSVAPQEAAYSSITRAELYAGKHADEPVIDLLLGSFEELAITRDVAEHGGRLRRQLDIPLPDALIAATAILARSILVTRNVRHFRRVAGLEIATR